MDWSIREYELKRSYTMDGCTLSLCEDFGWTLALLFKLQLEVYFVLVCLVVYVLDRTTLIIRLVEVYANAPQDRHSPSSYIERQIRR